MLGLDLSLEMLRLARRSGVDVVQADMSRPLPLRANLFDGQPAKMIHTYATAVKTVDPQKATGKPQVLWMEFARFYEKHDDLKNARVIFRKATQVPFKTVDDLASVWMAWAEMELRRKKYTEALGVLAEGTAIPPAAKRSKQMEEGGPVQARLYKHTKLWSFYADLQAGLSRARAAALTPSVARLRWSETELPVCRRASRASTPPRRRTTR